MFLFKPADLHINIIFCKEDKMNEISFLSSDLKLFFCFCYMKFLG